MAVARNRYLHPESSSLFTPWVDPKSGVRSWILTERAAPWQQAFYFTTPNVSEDGRFLWLYAASPPSPHVLAVADLARQEVRVHPETHFEAESPWVDPETGEAFFAHPGGVFRRGPEPEDPVMEVGHVGAEHFGGREIRRLSTHLTRSADARWLNLDVTAGSGWHVGAMEIATGAFELWQSFERRYQHSQFHPSDPELLLLAQDYWHDPETGERIHWENRVWLLRRGEAAQPLFPPEAGKNVKAQFHEWWSADGRGVWLVDVGSGTEYVDLASGEHRTVWPGGTCHSHASKEGTLLVGDVNTYRWRRDEPCRVAFYDAATDRELDIVSDWPPPPPRAQLGYHPDPHPQFLLDDELIAYTTTVFGRLDFALVRVAELLERTRGAPAG